MPRPSSALGAKVECAVKVLRVVGCRGGLEIGTQIIHMPRIHVRRFRMFLKQLKAGEIAPAPSSRRRRSPRGDRGPAEKPDTTPPFVPVA